jgi:hexosaminidase
VPTAIGQLSGCPYSQPEAIGGYLPLKKVYSYNPVSASLTAEQAKLVYGVQGNLWVELHSTPEHVEYMIYTRILALAETLVGSGT